ncbi:Ig-like domain-containing protein [Microbulbifer taiwanensis]
MNRSIAIPDKNPLFKVVIVALLSLSLSACGGGGGSSGAHDVTNSSGGSSSSGSSSSSSGGGSSGMSGSGSSGGAGGGDTSRSITAVDDEFLMDEDGGSLTANVLANDKIGGKLISLEVVDGPASGEVSVVSNAESSGVERFSLLYTPAPNFNGSDHFRYRITGEDNSSATAAVAITVDPVTDISNFKVEPGGDGANPKLLKFSWASDSNPHHFVLEVNPDGKSGYKEVDIDGEIAGDSTVVEVEMPLHLMHWELARYQLVAVGEGG